MRLRKIAGIGILFIFLIFAAWYGMNHTDISWTEKENAVQEALTAQEQEAPPAQKQEAPPAQEQEADAESVAEDKTAADDTDRTCSTAGAEPAAIERTLSLADIQEMDAGSILDVSDIREDTVSALFYSEMPGVDVQQRIMGVSFHENDNILMEELRYLRVLYLGFDGKTHIGELLVNQSIADDVLEIMEELYENGYMIGKMVLVDAYGADDELSMEDNNTSSFNYREIAGSSKLSRHSLGLAIDINPLYNPCVRDGGASVSPVNAAEYADRNQEFDHKIDEDDLCYRLFAEHGFTWGGHWNSLKDYQHFEK